MPLTGGQVNPGAPSMQDASKMEEARTLVRIDTHPPRMQNEPAIHYKP